jgi:subtilisin family serine protease
MASPHTAGVAALLVEVHESDAPFVRSRLYQTADDLGESGHDPFYGRGRVNAATAVGAN